MPSDQDESRAVLQELGSPDQARPVVQVQVQVPADDDFFDDDPSTDEDLAAEQLVDEAIRIDNLTSPDTESDLLSWTGSSPVTKQETFSNFWRHFAFALVPPPFALLVFLATLPATLQGSPGHLSPLIMAMLLLALMILQGTLLYFAGPNDTILTLDIVGGYALFIVVGVFAAFGPFAALLTFGVLLIGGVLLARRGLHQTRQGYVDIVTTFGKYAHTLEPGLNLLLPWEKVEYHLNTQAETWTSPRMVVPTAREQQVELTATISYQLLPEDAYLAATNVKNWETSLQSSFCGTVQSLINELTMADFVSWTPGFYTRSANGEAGSFNPAAATRWDRINNTLSRRMQDQVACWGVQINWVHIKDLTPLPLLTGNALLTSHGDTGGTTQIIKNDPHLAEAIAASQPKAAKAETGPVSVQPTTPAPVPTATPSAPKTASPGKLTPTRIETLVDMYNAVRQNVITDPTMIADLALRFEALANDPVANKNIDFDAARAAATLRQRAQQRAQQGQNATQVEQ